MEKQGRAVITTAVGVSKIKANLGKRHEERLLLVSHPQLILVLQCKSAVHGLIVIRKGLLTNFHEYILPLQLLHVT
jgi:hypothetical protein